MLIRPARPEDEGFLGRMLYEAAFWQPDRPRASLEDALARPELARYVTGWGRAGDVGVVAVENNTPIGAAWYRRFPPSDPGYGFVHADIPELSVGVRSGWREKGVGGALLDELISMARHEGLAALSLSVEEDNITARRLYEQRGFVTHTRNAGAWTMLRRLSADLVC